MPEAPVPVTCRVLCLPARALRDEIAGAMLTQLLRQQGFEAENASANQSSDELVLESFADDLSEESSSVQPGKEQLHWLRGSRPPRRPARLSRATKASAVTSAQEQD